MKGSFTMKKLSFYLLVIALPVVLTGCEFFSKKPCCGATHEAAPVEPVAEIAAEAGVEVESATSDVE